MSQLNIIHSTQDINDDSSFVVCCFYTSNYKTHADSLKSSLEKFELNYYFCEVEDAGYWEANTRLKPHFIEHCLNKFPEQAILYLDADAVVKKPLDYFNAVTVDVSFFDTRGMAGMSHDYLASTLFFNNTAATKTLVQSWIDAQKNGKRIQVDQDSLDMAMNEHRDDLVFEPLSEGYIKIFDREASDYEGEIYIEQYQASQRDKPN